MSVVVTVDSRLRMPLDGLPPEFVSDLMAEFTHENPLYGRLRSMGYRNTKEPALYETWATDGDELSLPRGGMDRLRAVLDTHGLDYEVCDRRSEGAALGTYLKDPWDLAGGTELFPAHKPVAWQHQDELVEAIRRNEQGVFRAPTGSGKTTALIKAIATIHLPSIVVVWDTGLLKQWQARIASELGIPVHEQGLIQGSTCRLRPITLAMQQTLNRWPQSKWDRIRGKFGLVAADECQRYAATTFTRTIDQFDCKYRIAVSASEKRKDRKVFLIYDFFGPVRMEVSRRDLVKLKVIHEVEVRMVETRFTAPWFTKRMQSGANFRRGDDFAKLLGEMERDDVRNTLAVDLAVRAAEDGPVLVFSHHVDHCMRLDREISARGVRSGLMLGGDEWSETFDETKAALSDGTRRVGVGTYGKIGVGIDIPEAVAGVVTTPIHNNREFFNQVKGRVCRRAAGKMGACIYVLWDRQVQGLAPLRNLSRWNDNVTVWDEPTDRWVPGKAVLKDGARNEAKAKSSDGIFA